MGNKSLFQGSMILLVLALAGFFLISYSHAEIFTGNSINNKTAISNDIQIVKMHVEGSSYVFEPSTVKKGIPVRLVADLSQMPGCSKSVVLSEFGVRKTFSSSDDYVEFTPTKSGKFYIACSMNMYKGTLEVLEANGAKSNYVQTAPTQGMTCGMGGGCGCGGMK